MFRFMILTLCTLCLSIIFSNMTIINFVMICLEPPENGTATNRSHSLGPQYTYTAFEKTSLQWAASLASAAATFPFSWAATNYGVRWIFFWSGLLSALVTALTPAAMALGFPAFIISRAVQGVAYACDFAVIGVLCTRWAPLRENAIFLAALTSFPAFSAFFTNSISGFDPFQMCELWGWPSVYYAHAAISLVLFGAWAGLYTDDPAENRFIDTPERAKIARDKTDAHIHRQPFVPYLAIGRDPTVLSVWLCAFASLLAGFFIVIYVPTYIKLVLNYSIEETGILGALVIFMNAPFKIMFGFISDGVHCMEERYKMWLFNGISLVGPAAGFTALCFVHTAHPMITVVLLGFIEATLGANCGGFYKCGSLASRQYAELVIGFTQFFKCAVFFFAPALVAVSVHDETNASQWHAIFVILAVTLVVAHAIFCVYATEKPRPFTQITASHRVKA